MVPYTHKSGYAPFMWRELDLTIELETKRVITEAFTLSCSE